MPDSPDVSLSLLPRQGLLPVAFMLPQVEQLAG